MTARLPLPTPALVAVIDEQFRSMIRTGRENSRIAALVVIATKPNER